MKTNIDNYHSDPNRGTGRTLKMVKSLPKSGATIVVHNHALWQYVRRMICDIHGKEIFDRTKVIIINQKDDAYQLMGLSRRIFIDHAFYDNVSRETERFVTELARGCNIRFDSEGNLK